MSIFALKPLPLVQTFPNQGEVAVHVARIALLPRTWPVPRSRFVFPHRYAKLRYFLWREGIRLTLSKVLASRIMGHVANARVLAVVFGEAAGHNVVAVGPLACEYVRVACFPEAWVAPIPSNRNEAWCHAKISHYFGNRADLLLQIFDYSPYSGVCPDFFIADVLGATGGDVDADMPIPFTSGSQAVRGLARGGPGDSPRRAQSRSERELTPRPRAGSRTDGRWDATDQGRRAEHNEAEHLFVAGAGAYVHAYVLPRMRTFTRNTVVDINPLLAVTTAERFGFRHAETSLEVAARRLSETESPIFIIATYHSTHVQAAEAAFAENPRTKIFVEKPPVTTFCELDRLLALRRRGAWVEIGYNRRFSPLVRRARVLIERESGPILMFCLVKELPLPCNHWYYWPSQGTRITGNLCHWVDLGIYIIDSDVVHIEAESAPNSVPGDEVSSTVHFADGSKLVLLATDRGNALRGVQEYINIRRGDTTIAIDDFLRMDVFVGGRSHRYRRFFRDKGHHRMYSAFCRAILAGESPSYSDDALQRSSDLYLRIKDVVLARHCRRA